MTQFEFQLLQIDEQLDVLYEHGVYVGKRKEDRTVVLLYQLEVFYVEVFYIRHRYHPAKLKCFRSTSLLDPYLDEIAVEHLV
jgi:hypothetical protein